MLNHALPSRDHRDLVSQHVVVRERRVTSIRSGSVELDMMSCLEMLHPRLWTESSATWHTVELVTKTFTIPVLGGCPCGA